VALLVASAHTIGLAQFSLAHSAFHGEGDDIEGFWLAKSLPFWKYLLSPIDVHRLLLHRFMSYLVYRVAPMNFAVAEVVLSAFHLAGYVVLFATLQNIQKTPANCVLTAWYAINPYMGPQLFWWTAG
jgi:hypothetical protein